MNHCVIEFHNNPCVINADDTNTLYYNCCLSQTFYCVHLAAVATTEYSKRAFYRTIYDHMDGFIRLLDKCRTRCLHQTGSLGTGSDHLQLIKFWRSCAPGKGVCGGGGVILALPADYSQRAVFVSLWALFHIILLFGVLFLSVLESKECSLAVRRTIPAQTHVP